MPVVTGHRVDKGAFKVSVRTPSQQESEAW